MQLYIDDERNPKAGVWDIVRSYNAAVHYMCKNGVPLYISFDHDLGDMVPTGFDIAKWMVERDLDDKGNFIPKNFEFNVHSANPIGVANIAGLLNGYLEIR